MAYGARYALLCGEVVVSVAVWQEITRYGLLTEEHAVRDPAVQELVRRIRRAYAVLFAFSSGGRRRSEVSAVLDQLVKVDDQTYVYRLARSKTDQTGTDHTVNADKPIVGPAAAALTAWLEASGVKSGAIFRRIRKTSG